MVKYTEKIEEFIEELADFFDLGSWKITFKVVDHFHPNDYWGQVSISTPDRTACIEVIDNLEYNTLFGVLLHEFLHIVTSSIDSFMEVAKLSSNQIRAVNFYDEEMVCSLERVFRREHPEWFADYRTFLLRRFMFDYCIDIDGIVTKDTVGFNYLDRIPNETVIEKLRIMENYCFYTARYGTAKDVKDTYAWLNKYGLNVPVFFGKPRARCYLDDRMVDYNEFIK